jgi:hypothetical protein
MSEPVIFRSRFGQVLTVVMIGLAVLVIVLMIVQGTGQYVLRFGWSAVLVAFATWALYWAPSVTVSDGGITVRNVLRTIELPWPAIGAVDTKYALTLITTYGKYTAWAAPAPGRHATLSARGDVKHLPSSTYVNGTIRPGDDLRTDSGQAALIVRRRWEDLRDGGFLDDARLERERPVIQWHWITIGVLVVLGTATVLGALS